MELLFLLAAIASFVVFVAVLVLCAKKQSFNISHDYDVNYVSRKPADNTYRVRHVHQPSPVPGTVNGNGNGNSKRSFSKAEDEVDGKVAVKEPESKTKKIGNNNVSVNIVQETPDKHHVNGLGTSKERSAHLSAKAAESPAKDGQRTPSKRKAPSTPTVSSSEKEIGVSSENAVHVDLPRAKEGPTQVNKSDSRKSKKQAPMPPKVMSPEEATRVDRAIERVDQLLIQNEQKQQQESSPDAQSGENLVHSSLMITPAQPSLSWKGKASQNPSAHQTTTAKATIDAKNPSGPLPQKEKSTPSSGMYVKKSAISPSRPSSKRRAPQAPAHPMSTPVVPEESKNKPSASKETPADKMDVEVVGEDTHMRVSSDANVSDLKQKPSRNALDRLPSIPGKSSNEQHQIDIQDSSITDEGVIAAFDDIDATLDDDTDNMSKEDPYSVIKRLKESEKKREEDINLHDDEKRPVVDDTTDEPPYMKIKQLQQESQAEDNDTENISKIHNEDQDSKKIPPEDSRDTKVILIPVDESPQDKGKSDKAEPPYAKVIKRNKRNRGNVRVTFNMEQTTEIKSKPPTPGLLFSSSSVEVEMTEDGVPPIPEGPDYI